MIANLPVLKKAFFLYIETGDEDAACNYLRDFPLLNTAASAGRYIKVTKHQTCFIS